MDSQKQRILHYLRDNKDKPGIRVRMESGTQHRIHYSEGQWVSYSGITFAGVQLTCPISLFQIETILEEDFIVVCWEDINKEQAELYIKLGLPVKYQSHKGLKSPQVASPEDFFSKYRESGAVFKNGMEVILRCGAKDKVYAVMPEAAEDPDSLHGTDYTWSIDGKWVDDQDSDQDIMSVILPTELGISI